jgi:hypothetical protein
MKEDHQVFCWVPGHGVDAMHLDMLRRQSTRPAEPMGEAWFMGENRRLYTELQGPITDLKTNFLQEVLSEIASGTSSFGSRPEWTDWFSWLLPELIPRAHDHYVHALIEELCTAFLQLDLAPDLIPKSRTYRYCVLKTLGSAIMDADRWLDGRIVLGRVLHRSNNNPAQIWGWSEASGDLAASMILCLRLLAPDQIEAWVRSLFSIDCPYWRAQLLTWIVGAQPLLSGQIGMPAAFSEASPLIGWSWSHCLTGMHGATTVASDLISSSNLDRLRACLAREMAAADFGVWTREILAIPALGAEAGPIIEQAFSMRPS